MNTKELKDLCGKHCLSGIERGTITKERYGTNYEDCNYIKFCLDGTNYMAVENPDDGYRSYCEDLVETDEPCNVQIPDTDVIGTMQPDDKDGTHDVLQLFDEITGEIVLRVGTRYIDDYYPMCVQEWHPENLACNQKGMKTSD